VPQDEVEALIEPWLGTGLVSGFGAAVPIPALIDVRLKQKANETALAAIRARLAQTAPSARIDAQTDWLKPVFAAISSLQWLAIALVALLAISLAAAVLLAVRNALGTNRETIEIIHLLGATDRQIARIFQRAIGLDAVGGGVVGFALALVVILFLGRRFAALGAGMIEGGTLAWTDWLLLTMVPVASVVLAMATARLTVLQALRKML
ncbi:MAG: cell division protein, partial [Novosphingobium sp.]|nr:cell division protein [Novosphingobium sp.]